MKGMTADVLVAGAGLAGLRAAWAAKEAAPDLTVAVLCPHAGPTGSSFAGANDCLGMQVPAADDDAFIQEVLGLAGPGFVDQRLVRALVRDAHARFHDLERLGLKFRRNPDGTPRLVPGCFSATPRAAVFNDLSHAFGLFFSRLQGMGVSFITGFELVGIRTDQHGISAAICQDRSFSEMEAPCRSLILAAGGPAPLFARHMAGPFNAGFSYGLAAEAGAKMTNSPFLQFLWIDQDSGAYCPPATLALPETRLLNGPNASPLPDVFFSQDILHSRARHCPISWGLDDRELDLALLRAADASGLVRLLLPDGRTMRLGLTAHAGNGGAVVDESGRTTVPGLLACGECATGMHGADRMGGAMVLATQVFGARAGRAAAERAAALPRPRAQGEAVRTAAAGDPAHMQAIGLLLQECGLPGRSAGREARHILAGLVRCAEKRTRLAARAASLVLGIEEM